MQPYPKKTFFESLLQPLMRFGRFQLARLPLDFDAQTYLELNPDLAERQINPFEHYLAVGQREGRPYLRQARTEKRAVANKLPTDFDPEEYRRINPDLENYDGNLQSHFLQHGIAEFRRYREDRKPLVPATERYARLPEDFDPDLYLELNPDVANPEIVPQNHYVDLGIHENRQYRFPDVIASIGRPIDAEKPTVLLISHEASRTGAPVLTWNILQEFSESHNTIVLLLGDGSLLPNFQIDANETYLIPSAKHNEHTARHLVKELKHRHRLAFAILNSIETGALCRPLTLAGIPSILLIHEFAANTMPREKFLDSRTWASTILFSTQLTKDDAMRCFPGGVFDDALVLPQGRCTIPRAITLPNNLSFREDSTPVDALQMVSGKRKLVIGIGSVCIRKGVDIFIEVASQMKAQAGDDAFEFLWVGSGYPDYDPEYSAFLADHIQRVGLSDSLFIVPDTDNLEALYDRASLLLLTSRLDPLPNIAIDAICKGLPIVCFDKASGIADVLKDSHLGADCVAAYINPSDMASKALRLCEDSTKRRIQQALQAIGETAFSMPNYCQHLFELHEMAKTTLDRSTVTAQAVIESNRLDVCYYTGTQPTARQYQRTYIESCWEFVLKTSAGTLIRKPKAGFNPFIYRERIGLDTGVDPFLHFIQNENTQQKVLPQVLGPDTELLGSEAVQPTVALHIHAYYPELLTDILERLHKNRTQVTLFITVDSSAKQAQIQTLLQTAGWHQANVSVHPNRGRDVYPFLALCESILDNYDIIGHIHTKKSPHVRDGSNLVTRWREMLLGNLLGSNVCADMLDRIVSHMNSHPSVQIVFPDDPHIIGWGKNLSFAKMMESPSDFASLPKYFDFPVGTMFWATSAYLDPFVRMALPERFTPEEPLPIDGTVLHAWERLLGAKAGSKPPGYALTFVPGLTR